MDRLFVNNTLTSWSQHYNCSYSFLMFAYWPLWPTGSCWLIFIHEHITLVSYQLQCSKSLTFIRFKCTNLSQSVIRLDHIQRLYIKDMRWIAISRKLNQSQIESRRRLKKLLVVARLAKKVKHQILLQCKHYTGLSVLYRSKSVLRSCQSSGQKTSKILTSVVLVLG